MSNNYPIKFSILLELKELGINPNSIKFGNITFQSDKTVLIREENEISIVDIKTKQIKPLKVSVDSAIMNPNANVLGLRAKNQLQIFNLDMRTKMKTIESSDAVIYWKWLNNKTIAYITTKSVFHWSMESNHLPIKKFDIQNDDRQIQIIGYNASNDGNWLFIQGITKGINGIDGVLQLYNVKKKRFQPKMNANGACFAYLKLDNRTAKLFCFTRKDNNGETRLFCIEIEKPVNGAIKIQSKIKFERKNDFMVNMVAAPEYGCLYGLTQQGFLYLFDILSGTCIFKKQIASTTVFLGLKDIQNNGIISVNRNGKITSFYVDSNNYVSYISDVLGNAKLAATIATKYNLTGADDMFKKRFNKLMNEGKYLDAAKIASESPNGVLRTEETIRMLSNAVIKNGDRPPDLQYYTFLLNKGKLNKIESIGLCRRIFQFNPNEGKSKIEKYLKQNQLTYSEDLGDLLVKYDSKLALFVFGKAKIPGKTILCFIQLGQTTKIIQYCKNENYLPNWSNILTYVHQMKRDQAKDFAQSLVDNKYLNAKDIISVLYDERNDTEKSTEFLLDYLQNRGDLDDDSYLQTKLFEINLRNAPRVAIAIFESNEYKFTKYNKNYIAKLCESSRLYQHALKHYDNLDDIKRVIQIGLTSNLLKSEFILNYFGDLTPDDALSCLGDILKYNTSGIYLKLVVEIAKRYSEQLTSDKLIKLFEKYNCFTGIFLYLDNIMNFTKDSELIFKYIHAASEIGQINKIESICKENKYYNPKQVKTFLLDNNKIKDPRPLIHVCDRHGFIDELTKYLYTNQMYRFIEVYVKQMNPKSTPKVVGCLLDLNTPEDQIRNLINMIRPPQCSINELVNEVEKRERLTLLLPWLETRFHEGFEDTSLHNALAKIYIDINNNPKNFLISNKYYDSKIVGKYCEKRDGYLAFIAYKRAWGSCDEELIEITSKHGFFKDQARYCVERKDLSLWKMVLSEDNKNRKNLIDQVVSIALPESRNPDEISIAVKAFMSADLPNELIELLERIMLSQKSDYNFKNNKNLQNLLILTAMKADTTRIIGYINKLDNYDGPDLAKICTSDQYKLYEEAFLMYKNFKKDVDAINVLLNDIKDIDRGMNFAKYCDKPEVWSILGRSQLNNEFLKPSIESFLKAGDAQHYLDVITIANKLEDFNDLIKYLEMAREKIRDKVIDEELIYAFAKVNDLLSLEKFITQSHLATLDKVGNRFFDKKLYSAAKIIFSYINNHAKLANVLVKLKLFKDAVDSARKANSIQTWKNVCYACINVNKFRLAQICGLNIIIFMDHLHDLVNHYENGGHFSELINLLEHGLNLDRAHQGIYTQLGVLYAKYKEKKLMEHINLFWSRLNIPTLIQTCKDNYHWNECVLLYKYYDQYDNAIDTMIKHSPSCWTHEKFKNIVIKVNSTEVFYRGINFYLNEHPLYLCELLIHLASKLDHKRVIQTIKMHGQIPIIKKYLQYIQKDNINIVNESLNLLYIEELNYELLRKSINEYDSFDQIKLAQKLEKHNLLQFRRISAYLYKRNKRIKISIELSKKDKLWKDAIKTASESKNREFAEKLLIFFVNTKDCPKSCFASCLFQCYKLIRADIVLELAWKNNLMELAMPYMIQTFRSFNNKLDYINEKINEQEMKNNEYQTKIKKADQNSVNQAALMLLHNNNKMIELPNYNNNYNYNNNNINNNSNGYVNGFLNQ